jgi:predicted aminopeptidase
MIESNIGLHHIPARQRRPIRGVRRRDALAFTFLVAAAASLSGCGTAGYIGQAIRGHVHLLREQREITAVLRDPALPAEVRAGLRAVPEILALAADVLMLPSNGNYRTFVEVRAPYVAWNVFAAPPYSLEARAWCYPVSGCVTYRGYFSEAAARAEARRLQSQGDDVFVGGVTAYSTLGWFDEPVLSTMLRPDKLETAALLFHELAHGKFWLPGDTELNEAFAEAVARIGTERAARTWDDVDAESFRARLRQEDEFYALIVRHKHALQSLYDSGKPEPELRVLKQRQLESLRADYRALKSDSGDPGRFDAWLASDLNNAKLAAVSAYRELVPGLLEAYRRTGRDISVFYRQVEQLKRCSREERHAWVRGVGPPPLCATSHSGAGGSSARTPGEQRFPQRNHRPR